MKILLYLDQLLLKRESHSLPLFSIILLTVGRKRNAKEIETGTGTGVVVVAIGIGIEIGIGTGTGTGIVVIVIAPEGQMTITTINQGGGSMIEPTTTCTEVMISMPNLDGMKMSIVLGIVIVKSAIGIGNTDQKGRETGSPDRTENPDQTGRGIEGTETEGTETEETGTEEAKTEETGIGIGIGNGERGTGTEETETETETETKTEKEKETKVTGKGNGETGTEINLIIHIPRHLVKARHLRRQQVTLLGPSSKKCLLLTLTAVELCLTMQKQTQVHNLVLND